MKLNWFQIFVLKLVGKVLGIPSLVNIVREATESTEIFDLWEAPRLMPTISDEDTVRRFHAEFLEDESISFIRLTGYEPAHYNKLQQVAINLGIPILIEQEQDSDAWIIRLKAA